MRSIPHTTPTWTGSTWRQRCSRDTAPCRGGGEYLAVNHALKNVRVNPARCPKASVPRRGAGPGARGPALLRRPDRTRTVYRLPTAPYAMLLKPYIRCKARKAVSVDTSEIMIFLNAQPAARPSAARLCAPNDDRGREQARARGATRVCGLSLTREITKPLSRSAPPHTYRSRPLSPPQTKRRREDAARTSKTGRRDPRDSPRRPRPASNLTALDSPGAAPRARHVALTLSPHASTHAHPTDTRAPAGSNASSNRRGRPPHSSGLPPPSQRTTCCCSHTHSHSGHTHTAGMSPHTGASAPTQGHEPPYRGISPHTGA